MYDVAKCQIQSEGQMNVRGDIGIVTTYGNILLRTATYYVLLRTAKYRVRIV